MLPAEKQSVIAPDPGRRAPVLRWNLRFPRHQRVLVEVYPGHEPERYDVLVNGEPGFSVTAKERGIGAVTQYKPSHVSRHWYGELQAAVEGGVKKLRREKNLP